MNDRKQKLNTQTQRKKKMEILSTHRDETSPISQTSKKCYSAGSSLKYLMVVVRVGRLCN